MADALSRLPNHIEPVGILGQTCDAHIFTLQLEWLQSVYEYLLEGVMPQRLTTSQRQCLAKGLNHLCFKNKYYTYSDKITSFVEFCNQNKYSQFCRNYGRTFFF